MLFIKRHFCVKFGEGIALFILLIFLEAFGFSGIDAAMGDKENISAFEGADRWQFRGLDGTDSKLSQFKGKVIFINIWATWCTPCISEMQSVQKLYNTFKDEDVVFLIASNEKEKRVQRFYEKNNYTFPVYLIDRNVPEPFQSPIIPSTFIIDREGKIVLKHMGAEDWNHQSCHEFIRSLLSPQSDNSKTAKPFSDSANNWEEAKKRMKDQRVNAARSSISSRLEPFADQQNLSPDVKEKLINIRVEEHLKMTELMSGGEPTANRIYEMNKIQSDSDEKISRLLSEEIYDAYKRYKRFENEWVTVSQINKELKFHGIQLAKDQEEQLVVAMYNDRQEMMVKQMKEASQGGISAAQSQEEMMKRNLEYQKSMSSIYVDSAKNILTEPQLKIFKRYLDNQTYMLERSLINRSQLSPGANKEDGQ